MTHNIYLYFVKLTPYQQYIVIYIKTIFLFTYFLFCLCLFCSGCVALAPVPSQPYGDNSSAPPLPVPATGKEIYSKSHRSQWDCGLSLISNGPWSIPGLTGTMVYHSSQTDHGLSLVSHRDCGLTLVSQGLWYIPRLKQAMVYPSSHRDHGLSLVSQGPWSILASRIMVYP